MSLPNTPFDPAREAALVTGAGNGIGHAIAQALVGEGVRSREAVAGEKEASVLRVARISRRFGRSHLAGDDV
jgi:NAD(P)-dependent dehydrogenase (short-subunit alcohol dehydrogenase family)